MEVVLQWLDDLEDLVFMVVALRERLCSAMLQIGLLASLGLHATQWWSAAAAQASVLFLIASSSVGIWAAAQLPMLRERSRAVRVRAAT